jgi:two-component sensor histidine kinase
MDRLARFDISRQFARPAARHTAQIAFGVGCVAAMVAVRSAVDLWLPNLGPFALVYPTVMAATLFGHWRAGLAAYLLSFLWAWYVVMPESWSFHFVRVDDGWRLAINLISALVVLILAESFRLAVERSRDALHQALDRRMMLLTELEHRTKNNFALVASLLEIQKRRLDVPGLSEALDDAIGRVRTFADAYSNLAYAQEEGTEVAMKPYLDDLLERISSASFHDGVTLEQSIAEMELPREVGVGIGLFLNEALANAAKYAFADGRPGRVEVTFAPFGKGWRLLVQDDGDGKSMAKGKARSKAAGSKSGLGTSLMAAFAEQARASLRTEITDEGFCAELIGSSTS